MKNKILQRFLHRSVAGSMLAATICLGSFSFSSCTGSASDDPLINSINWEEFLSQHDMYWNKLTSDPVEPSFDGRLTTGYYAGAIMGNGLLGTNL